MLVDTIGPLCDNPSASDDPYAELQYSAGSTWTQQPPDDCQIVGQPRPQGEQAISSNGPTQCPESDLGGRDPKGPVPPQDARRSHSPSHLSFSPFRGKRPVQQPPFAHAQTQPRRWQLLPPCVLQIASPEAREWLHIPGKLIGRRWQPAPPPPAPLTPADPHHRTGVRNRNVFSSSKEFDFSPGYAQHNNSNFFLLIPALHCPFCHPLARTWWWQTARPFREGIPPF